MMTTRVAILATTRVKRNREGEEENPFFAHGSGLEKRKKEDKMKIENVMSGYVYKNFKKKL